MENFYMWDELLKFIGNNWEALLGFVGTGISFVRNIKQFVTNKKQELQIERLKAQLDIEKTKILRNDEKFRNSYESFLTILMGQLHKDKKISQIEQGIIDFIKVSILFAGPETIKMFGDYRKIANVPQENNKIVLEYMDKLFLSMRKDLGVSNEGLKEFDVLQTLIVGDIKKALDSK